MVVGVGPFQDLRSDGVFRLDGFVPDVLCELSADRPQSRQRSAFFPDKLLGRPLVLLQPVERLLAEINHLESRKHTAVVFRRGWNSHDYGKLRMLPCPQSLEQNE